MLNLDPVIALLDEYFAAGVITSEQKNLWIEIFERLAKVLTSNEYRAVVEQASMEFVSRRKNELNFEPTPEYLKALLEKLSFRIPVTPHMEEELKPFVATGVVNDSSSASIRIKAISLLPKTILRVGYSLPEEVENWGWDLIEKSQCAWKALGQATQEILGNAIVVCDDVENQIRPPGLIEEWGANDLYDAGSIFYRNSSEAAFVFSTTSGLVIPSEYDPLAYQRKNIPKYPGRAKYFKELLNDQTQLKRFYQWDRYSTAKVLYETCQEIGLEYVKQGSLKSLVKALQMPNFEITESDFGRGDPLIYDTKTTLTITCRRGVVISQRKEEFKSITHCIYTLSPVKDDYELFIKRYLPKFQPDMNLNWDNNFLETGVTNHSIPAVLYHKVYRHGITEVIKPLQVTLDLQTAADLANVTFNRLYDLGKTIVDQGITIGAFNGKGL